MLLSLQQAILIRPERPWMEAFAALPGGALLVLVSGIVENKYIKYMRTGNVSIRDIGAGGVNSLHRSLPARAHEVICYGSRRNPRLQNDDAIIASKDLTGVFVKHVHNVLSKNDRRSLMAISVSGADALSADPDASKLETGYPNLARTAMGRSLRVRWIRVGAGYLYCGNSIKAKCSICFITTPYGIIKYIKY